MTWFGLKPPDEATEAWGARAIITDRRLDLLPDRQGVRSLGERLDSKLSEWIDDVVLPDIRDRLRNSDSAFNLMSNETVTWSGTGFQAKACPNSSGGYLYIVAWRDDES